MRLAPYDVEVSLIGELQARQEHPAHFHTTLAMRYFPKRNDASASFGALSSDGFGPGHHIVAVGADVELRSFLLELEDGLQSTRPFAHSSGQLSLSIIKSKQGLGWVDLICHSTMRCCWKGPISRQTENYLALHGSLRVRAVCVDKAAATLLEWTLSSNSALMEWTNRQ